MHGIDDIYINDLKFKKIVKWNYFAIIEHDFHGDIDCNFEIKPLEWLKYAKENISIESNKGLVDGLSNAKRAIECQVDTIISFLGYDFKVFDNRDKYESTKKFIKGFYKNECTGGITDRLKLLNVLGLAPTFLVSKIRRLRNCMEHEYTIPSKEAVREAIDVAELFIHSSDRLISFMIITLCFGSDYKIQCNYHKWIDLNQKYMVLEYKSNKKYFQLTLVEGEDKCFPYSSDVKYHNIKFSVEDEVYPYFLYCVVNRNYEILPEIFGSDIPKENIKYEVSGP